MDVDGGVGFLYCLEHCWIRMPNVTDIIVEVEVGIGVVGGVVVTQ